VSDSARSGADAHFLREAIELSRRCPPSPSAFSVGAILVAADGAILATGYSREHDPHDHAEEAALAKLANPATPSETTPPRPTPPRPIMRHGPR